MDGLQDALLNLLAVVITGAIGVATRYVVTFLKQKGILATLQAKESSVLIAVDAIEQIAKNEKVPDKFNAAKRMAIDFLSQQGIKITDEELQTLIESAVAEINKNTQEVIKN